MKNTTVLMAAVLAVATVLAVELIVLPSSVQEVQANPCSVSDSTLTSSIAEDGEEAEVEIDCEL